MIQETSREAFKDIQESLGERQILVLNALKRLCQMYGSATDREIAFHLSKGDPNFVRPRRFELVNKYKLVGFAIKRPCRITGKTALAWKVLK